MEGVQLIDEGWLTSDLVRRGSRGDEVARAELVRRHLRAAYAVALAVTRRPADAEDIAQEAFIIILSRLADCDPERFLGWFTTIVRNLALRAAKARSRREAALLDGDRAAASGERPADPGLRRQLLAALEALTPTQREVVLLHELHDWTHTEIAQALALSEVNCRQHLFTARRALRARLEKTMD